MRSFAFVLVLAVGVVAAQADIISIDFGASAPPAAPVAGPLATDVFSQASVSGATTTAEGLTFAWLTANGSDGIDISPSSSFSVEAAGATVDAALNVSGIWSDTIRHNGGGGRQSGFRLSGLADGTYTVALTIASVNGGFSSTDGHVHMGSAAADANDPTDITGLVMARYGDFGTSLTTWTPQSGDGNAWNVLVGEVTISQANPVLFVYADENVDKLGFTAIQIIPEPTSVGLLALGGLAILKRRRG